MNLRITITLAFTCLLLTGCQTLSGMQKDFKNFTGSIKTKAETVVKIAATDDIDDGRCPPITMDPVLSHITEFHDMDKTSQKNKVSEIAITDIQSKCSKSDDGYLNMRVDIHFDGALGVKARRRKNDRPFFAYPYFIVVTDAEDNELAREIFAASVTYRSDQETITLLETLKQRLPLNDDGSVPSYKVQVGFQLTEDQLFFNTSE